MNLEKNESIIESILFAAGREVKIEEIVLVLELSKEEVVSIIENMRKKFIDENRGIEIIKVNEAYQMSTKKENYEYVYPVLDNRSKPNLSSAALETLSIICYNPKITRAEIEAIRGVNSDGTIYKLLEYDLIQDAGKLDIPGRPTSYKVTKNFLKMFGISNLDELPELPRYKLDENEQIVIEEIMSEEIENRNNEEEIKYEAPMPEREDLVENNEN